jgi:HEAT repeat protein
MTYARAFKRLTADRDARTVQALLGLLRDGDWWVRSSAAQVLGRLAPAGTYQPLSAALAAENHHGARVELVRALGRVGDPRAADDLLKVLAEPHHDLRLAAAEGLGNLGDRRAVGPLCALLGDPSSPLQLAAVKALARLGDPQAIRPLGELLGEGPTAVRREVATTLARWDSPEARAFLALALEDSDSAVAETVRAALRKAGALREEGAGAVRLEPGGFSPGPLLGLLGSDSPRLRVEAARALARGGDARGVGALEALLNDKVESVQREAAAALAALGWKPAAAEQQAWLLAARAQWDGLIALGEAARAPLLAHLGHAGCQGCLSIVAALGGVRQEWVWEVLLRLLGDADRRVHAAAAEVLGQRGDARAVPPLLNLSRQRGADLAAVEAALARLGRCAVAPLVEALEQPSVQAVAVQALGAIGDGRAVRPLLKHLRVHSARGAILRIGRNAVPELVAVLQDPSAELRIYTADFLGEVGDRSAVAPLVALLKDRDDKVRRNVARALTKLQWKPAGAAETVLFAFATDKAQDAVAAGAPAVAALVALLDHEDPRLAADAAQALGRIADPTALPALVAKVRDRKSGVRAPAVRALAGFGAAALGPLLEAVADPDWQVRQEAVRGLGAVKDARAIEALIGLVRDHSPGVRVAAATTLGTLEDARAVAPLAALLDEPAHELRAAAAGALVRLKWQPADLRRRAQLLIAGGDWKALGDLQSPETIDPALQHMFSTGGRAGGWVEKALLPLVPVSSLTEELVRWAVAAATYEHRYRGHRYDAGYIDFTQGDVALGYLCRIESPVTSNLLHLVTRLTDVTVHMNSGCGEWDETVSFRGRREAAAQELARRGNPPYRPEAYARTSAAEADRVRAATAEELRREKERRYHHLLSLLANPQTGRGEDRWTYYQALARDFPTPEVFRRLAGDLASYRYLTPSELYKFMGFLVTVGAALPWAEVKSSLAPVQAPWPKAYAEVLERIKSAPRKK